jgi:hypothetical protein
LEEDPRGKLCAATVTSAPRLASPLYILYVPKEASRGGLAFYAPVRCCSSCRRFDNHSRIPVLPILVAGLTTTFPSTSSSSSSSSSFLVVRASAGKFVEEGTREGVDSATRAMQKMRRIERDREARRVLTGARERKRGRNEKRSNGWSIITRTGKGKDDETSKGRRKKRKEKEKEKERIGKLTGLTTGASLVRDDQRLDLWIRRRRSVHVLLRSGRFARRQPQQKEDEIPGREKEKTGKEPQRAYLQGHASALDLGSDEGNEVLDVADPEGERFEPVAELFRLEEGVVCAVDVFPDQFTFSRLFSSRFRDCCVCVRPV